MTLTHVDSANRPTMVDVGGKAVMRRTAVARSVIEFPVGAALDTSATLRTKKGPVFDTAIIAGVMAAKRTYELIPFCHPIALEDCKIAIDWAGDREVVVECSVSATHKTGVEMEALTGASVAALTIYDMCKALSHGIRIREVSLVSKTGGKRDYVAGAEPAAEPGAEPAAEPGAELAADPGAELAAEPAAEAAAESAAEPAAGADAGNDARSGARAGTAHEDAAEHAERATPGEGVGAAR